MSIQRSAPSLISSHEEITAEWLSAALNTDVGGVSCRSAPQGGMTGVVVIVDILDADVSGGVPQSVVVKLPAATSAGRAAAVAFDAYRREVLFYERLAPLTPARTPRLLFSKTADASSFVMVMEDLSGYRQGDQVAGCAEDDAAKVITEMGILHASFWGRVDDPHFDFVPLHAPSHHGDAIYQYAVGGWDTMLATFGDLVPDPILAVRERFNTSIPCLQAWLGGNPRTLAHGDFRMDNLLFGQTPTDSPVVVLDWQGCLRSHGIQDVAYFLSESVATPLRREHERELVGLWHDTLQRRGVTDYTTDAAWLDYRRAVLYLWAYVVVIAATAGPMNARDLAWMQLMVSRAAAAIEDLDALSLLES